MHTLMISLESKSRTPLYEQIYNFIKREIQKQSMRAGERLPSSRSLCVQLGISRSTVDLAYDQLASEGYIEAVPCKGFYICDIEQLYQLSPKPSKRITAAEKKEYFFYYDFELNGIAPGSFPYNTWKKLAKQALQEGEQDMFKLGDSCGELSFREAIADYLYHARGVNCLPDQIIVGAGNDYLLMLLSTITGTNHTLAMENPTYQSAYHAFIRLGYSFAAIGQDAGGMKTEELTQTEADIAYVMPSHQFPLGTVMPMQRRIQLLNWAAKGERYIIEDDYDSEFRYKGKPIPALCSVAQSDCVIYLGTFSKSIAPAIRISYMVLPKKLMEVYISQGKSFSVTVSKADQCILEHFLRDGYYERHLNKMRAVYRSKHDLMLNELRNFSGICTYSGENAGVHILLHFINGLTEAEAVRRAKEQGIRVYPLADYYIKEEPDMESATVLLGYATLTEEEISNAMQLLKKTWDIYV